MQIKVMDQRNETSISTPTLGEAKSQEDAKVLADRFERGRREKMLEKRKYMS